MNVGQAAHLSGQMSGQTAQMNQVPGTGVGVGVGVGGADGLPQHQPMQEMATLSGTDQQFVMMRTNMREKIFDYIGRKQSSAEWRKRLPELAKRLEEILYRKFPNKNDYYNMMMGPVEPQLQFAIKTLSAQNQHNQQNPQMARQIASSSSLYANMGTSMQASVDMAGSSSFYSTGSSPLTTANSQSMNAANLQSRSRTNRMSVSNQLNIQSIQQRPQRKRKNEVLDHTEKVNFQSPQLTHDLLPRQLSMTQHQVVRTSLGLYTKTVHEDSSYMELNILERIFNGSEEPSPLDFTLLHSITENFSEKNIIGRGGCGIVYKGILRNGVVAVKKLHNSRTIKNKMFHREVLSLISVKHQNIVRFLGYCSFTKEHAVPYEGITIMADIRERLLCFEYIRNGSLDKHLSDELRGLEWQTRYQIIIGICRGLHYLHKDKKIIHMDLKPGNILLDDLMVPKITDFGLSRSISDSQATTTLLISQGYAAPEYILGGKVTSKSDIYSLGVIILELVTGSKTKPNIIKVLRRWNHRWIKSVKHSSLVYQQVAKCLELALRCTQDDPADRPDISDVIDELNKIDTTDGQTQIQIGPCCLEDILGIEPLEVHIPFEDLKISHSIELTNDTDDYIAFVTKAKLKRFCTDPDRGIVPPRSKCSVTLAMQARVSARPNERYTEVITVRSTRVEDGTPATMDTVTAGDIFNDSEEGKVVDEVKVTVVFGKPELPEEE